MSIFRPYEPDQQLLLPPSLREWLPADHLIWFISETVDQLDLTHILAHYEDRGPGNLPYHPAMMLKLLIGLRGRSKVTGEFNLVCLALNLRRMNQMMHWT